MSRTIYLLNGPNLNFLGKRDIDLYGHRSLLDVENECRSIAIQHGFQFVGLQTNDEYEMVEWLNTARTAAAGIVINPSAFCCQSSIRQALSLCSCPIVEVDISSTQNRESWYPESILTAVVATKITDMGVKGYRLAMEYLVNHLEAKA